MQALDTAPEVSFSPLSHRYTLEEFWALPDPDDRSHYELIGGFLFMVPPPDPPHGSIDSRLNRSLLQYLLTHKDLGEVHHPREPIYTDRLEGTYLEPDMMYISQALGERMGRKRTSADIVFEYVSASNAVYDRTTKADTYLALGVRELWLVDHFTMTVEVRYATERKGKPAWETWRYSKGDLAESRVLAGWQVSVDELFDGLV
ncbi:MAG: Uma2 family endonuclease [Pyrinomonadaceae bacterium]|nr:Uma2 family endonuclease [Pyrinomonadaceae bacterium]